MAMRRSTRMMLVKDRLPSKRMGIEYETFDPEQRGRESEMRMGYDRPDGRSWEPYSRASRLAPLAGDSFYGPWAYGYDGMEDRYGGARSEYPDADMRFRDRRGRQHYNNGRFAPTSNWRDISPLENLEKDGDMMRRIGFNANWGAEMLGGADASIPHYNEMDRMPGNRAVPGGYMAQGDYGRMDEQTAMAWAKGMRNDDGSKAPHWTMEQVRQVMSQKGVDMDLPEFFAIMNALYSDYDPVFKRHNVSTMDFYVDMAKAWLKDKDAVPNKAMAYYECIVKK